MKLLIFIYIFLHVVDSKTVKRESNLSYEKFMNEYVNKHVPVIITDYSHVFLNASKNILKECGQKQATLAYTNGSGWANLHHESTDMTVSDLLKPCGKTCYGLFDWPLPRTCPSFLEKHWIMPKYFAQDLLQKVKKDIQYKGSWPSFFIGHDKTFGGLHKDIANTAFWQYVIQGTKRWVILSQGSIDPPNFFEQEMYKVDVHAGELIFIPGGSPHQVKNEGLTMAFAGNVILNMEGVLEEVSDSDGSYYKEVHEEMFAPTFDTTIDISLEEDITWKEWKHILPNVHIPVVHIVFINLEKREGRRLAMEKQVANTMWHGPYVLSRLNAITGSLERTFKKWPQPVPEDTPWANQVRPYWTRPVTRGEVGCTLSHLAAINMLRGKQGITIILEDDAGWNTKTFSLHLHHLIRQLNAYDPDWDMLLLGAVFLTPPHNATRDLVRVGYFYQAHAYVVSPRGFSKLMLNDTIPLVAWDELLPAMAKAHPQPHLNTLYMRNTPLRIYSTRNKLAWQKGKTHDTDL